MIRGLPKWLKIEEVDESVYADPPEDFAEWSVLDRIEWNLESMRARITVGATARKRLSKVVRNQRIGFIIFAVLVAIAFFGVWYNVDQNKDVLKTGCENSNESRAVQRNLWNGILDAPPDPGEPPPTDAEQRVTELFRAYINDAFQERDCKDLGREYPAPEFPNLGG